MKFPIPSDWDGESWCEWAVCWPDSELWRGFLRGLLTLPQRGWTWDERTGIVTEVQEIGREITRLNIDLRGVLVACNDPGLQDIALALHALAARQCCEGVGARQGSGGEGTTQPPFWEVAEGNPEIDPPPEGFESWEEFYSDKCSVATDIVNLLQRDLGDLALRNFGNISLSGIAALITITIATPIPFDDIVAIAGVLLFIGAEIVVTSALSVVNDNEQELICALYEGGDATGSRNVFLSTFNSAVDSAIAEPITAFSVKALVSYWVGPSNVNRLYYKDLTRIWTGGDCSGCGPGWEIYQLASGGLAGVLDSGDMSSDTELFVVSSVLEISGDPCEGDNVISLQAAEGSRVVSVSVVGGSLNASNCGIDWAWTRAIDSAHFEFNDGSYNFNAEIGVEPIFAFFTRSTTPFSLEFVVTLD